MISACGKNRAARRANSIMSSAPSAKFGAMMAPTPCASARSRREATASGGIPVAPITTGTRWSRATNACSAAPSPRLRSTSTVGRPTRKISGRSAVIGTPIAPEPATVPASWPTAVVRPSAPTSVMSSRREIVRTAARPIRPAAPATTTLCTGMRANLLLDRAGEARLLIEWTDHRQHQPVEHEELFRHPPDVLLAHRVHIAEDLVEGDLAAEVLLGPGQLAHAAPRRLQGEHEVALEGLLGPGHLLGGQTGARPRESVQGQPDHLAGRLGARRR